MRGNQFAVIADECIPAPFVDAAVGVLARDGVELASVERLKWKQTKNGRLHVDKTAKILELIDNGKCYFLSRPRRFGKSLFVDTIKELFEGNETLFEGLAIHRHWDWRERHPVVRLDLSGSFRTPEELEENLLDQFADIAEQAGIDADAGTAAVGLRRLIRGLRRHAGQRVALLVDEYDKPILDALATPALARANRDLLHDFDVVVEDSSSHGHLDMAVVYKDKGVYLFKVVESQAHGLALEQLRERDYAAKYRGQQEAIYLIGVEFSKETRNLVAFDVQPAQEAPA